AIQQDHLASVSILDQQIEKVALGATAFGEHDGLAGGTEAFRLAEGFTKSMDQGIALGVVVDIAGEGCIRPKFGKLLLDHFPESLWVGFRLEFSILKQPFL